MTLLQDLRYGARTLRRNPGFTAVAVLTLALGVGANSAMFSLVYGILLAPLPFPGAARLVAVTGTYPTGAVVAMRERVRTMDIAAYSAGLELNLTGLGTPIRVTGARVSPEFFRVLQSSAEFGRTFESGEDAVGRDDVVVISDGAWTRHFQQSADILGRPIELDGVSRRIVGVMPAAFRFPTPVTDFWVPLRSDPATVATYWAGDFMPVVARLRQDSSLEAARAEIRAFQTRVATMFPWRMPADWNRDVSVVPLRSALVADARDRLLLLAGAALAVLLIACANIANLTLSRAAFRRTELLTRFAIGAARMRIVRQLLTESVLLAAIGSALGLLLAVYGVPILELALPSDTPRLADVHLDWRVLSFTAGLAIATGLICGIAPALYLSRPDAAGSLRSVRGAGGSVPRRLRRALVVAEIAFAVLLVSAAGLLIRSFRALSQIDPGFRAAGVMTARLTPNGSFCGDVARCFAFYRQVLHDVSSVSGVAGAALVSTPPLGGKVAKRSLELEGLPMAAGETRPLFWMTVVTDGYFRVMGIPVVAGADFGRADWSGHPPAVMVTASAARRFWKGENPIGKRIRFVGEREWRTVIGIAANVRAYDLRRDEPDWMQGTVYVPYAPNATLEDGRVPAEMTLVVRTTSRNLDDGERLRRIVAAANPDVPVADVRPLRASLTDAVSTPASTSTLIGAFAAVALVLGAVGIYGVLSFLVSHRTREIGIRVALGAPPRQVLWLVMQEGVKVSVAGIAAGLASAFIASRWLSTQLYGVSRLDPVTYLSVALLMLAVTLLACAVPTRRALRVDPLIALREANP